MKKISRAAIVCAFMTGGCAQTQVYDRTIAYTGTISDLEDKIVIDNISRFIDDDNRIPTQVDLKQGQTQGVDNLSLGLTYPFTHGASGASIVKSPRVFNIGAAQVQSQDNWTYVPVTDVDDLVRVRCLYKYAINQSKNVGKFLSWDNFYANRCLVSNVKTPSRYGPPSRKWLKWTPASIQSGDVFLDDDPDHPLDLLGMSGEYAIWGRRSDFHDFELAILGSMPNTTGATGSAQTSKPPEAATASPLALKVDVVPTKLTPGDTSVKFTYTLSNNGTVSITDIVLTVSPAMVFQKPCQGKIDPSASMSCVATHEITAAEHQAKRVTAFAFAKGVVNLTQEVKSGTVISDLSEEAPFSQKTVAPKLPELAPTTSFTVKSQGLTGPNVTFPPFSFGKGAGTVIAPPQPAAQ